MKFFCTVIFLGFLVFSCRKDPGASCSDGILNQNETTIDCGGTCGHCPEVYYPQYCYQHGGVLNALYMPFVNYNGTDPAIDMKAIYKNMGSLAVHFTDFDTSVCSVLMGFSYGYEKYGNYTPDIWAISNVYDSSDAELFLGGSGSATVEYYENGADTSGAPSFSKVLSW